MIVRSRCPWLTRAGQKIIFHHHMATPAGWTDNTQIFEAGDLGLGKQSGAIGGTDKIQLDSVELIV